MRFSQTQRNLREVPLICAEERKLTWGKNSLDRDGAPKLLVTLISMPDGEVVLPRGGCGGGAAVWGQGRGI